jgi:hypothetical protein
MRWILISFLVNVMVFELQAKSINQNSTFSNNKVINPTSAAFPNKAGPAIPQEMNYQGWLGNKNDTLGIGITGNFSMRFAIYNDSVTGNLLWSETQKNISVTKGIFNVLLGSLNPIPVFIFTETPLWIETQIDSQILSPRKKLVSVPFAIKAENATYADTVKCVVICSTYAVVDSVSPHFLRKDIPDSSSDKIAYKFKFTPNQTFNGGTGLWCLLDTVTNSSKTWQAICGQVYAKNIKDINEFQATQGIMLCLGQNGTGDWGQTIKYMGDEGYVATGGTDIIHDVILRGFQAWAEAKEGNIGSGISCEGVHSVTKNKSPQGSSYNFIGTQSCDGNGNRTGLFLDLGLGGAGSGFKSAGEIAGVKVYAYNDTTGLSNSVYGGWFSAGTSSSNDLPYTMGIYAKVDRKDGTKDYAGYFDGNVKINGNLITNNNLILSNGELILSDGDNGDVILSNKTYFRVSGPTHPFSISGFSPIPANKIIIIYNATNQNMTIKNNSGTNSANGIYTLKDADITTNGSGSVTIIYDIIEQRWIVTSWQE